MPGRFLKHAADDVASFAAVLLVSGGAILTWSLAGIGRPAVPTKTAALAGEPGVAIDLDGPEGRAEVDSAELRAPRPKDAALPKQQKQERRALNVLLVTIDTLRFDLGFMGYPRPVSPNIDAFAGRSVVYENAYAMASFTPKCLGPLLIGRYSSETYRDYEHYTNFHPANVFLAERVVAAGGHTVGAATHRYFGWKKGFDQGFDVWDTSSIPPNSVDNDPTVTSERLTNAAIELLSSTNAADVPVRKDGALPPRSGPAEGHFFAWFHYLDPHLPYVAHEGAPRFGAMGDPRIPKERAAYDAEVWYTDQQVGRLLEHVRRQPWAKDTAVIVTADHGEAFGERSHWGHGRELWEPLVHVPLLVYVPGLAPRRIEAKRSHIDIVPTVLELMGLPADPELHGKSLLADARAADGEIEERDVFIDMPAGPFNEMRRAVVTGASPGLKLIDFGGRYELYDLQADPRETKNLSYTSPAQLREAKDAMTRVRSSLREIATSIK